MKDGKKFQHDGIRIEFIGSIELFYDRGNHYEFVSMAQELASGGEMRQAQQFDFAFKNVEKQYESYSGINVKLRSVSASMTVRGALPSLLLFLFAPPSLREGRKSSRTGEVVDRRRDIDCLCRVSASPARDIGNQILFHPVPSGWGGNYRVGSIYISII